MKGRSESISEMGAARWDLRGPSLNGVRPKLTDVGQIWADVYQLWPNPTTIEGFRASLTKLGPPSTKFGPIPINAKSGRAQHSWADFDQIGSDPGRVWLRPDQLGTVFDQTWAACNLLWAVLDPGRGRRCTRTGNVARSVPLYCAPFRSSPNLKTVRGSEMGGGAYAISKSAEPQTSRCLPMLAELCRKWVEFGPKLADSPRNWPTPN